MAKHWKLCPQAMLLAGMLASSMVFSYGQTTTTPPASKPAAKKPATAGATKSAATKSAATKSAATKSAATKSAAAPLSLTTQKDKISYAIGADLGNKLKTSSIDVDATILTQALKDTLSGSKTSMTDDEIHSTLVDLSKELQAKQAAAAKELSDKNKKAGEEFLVANKAKEG